jgi:hypothetical protein
MLEKDIQELKQRGGRRKTGPSMESQKKARRTTDMKTIEGTTAAIAKMLEGKNE